MDEKLRLIGPVESSYWSAMTKLRNTENLMGAMLITYLRIKITSKLPECTSLRWKDRQVQEYSTNWKALLGALAFRRDRASLSSNSCSFWRERRRDRWKTSCRTGSPQCWTGGKKTTTRGKGTLILELEVRRLRLCFSASTWHDKTGASLWFGAENETILTLEGY